MSKYTTGEMAKLCGVSVRTVQYYDTRGILIPSELSEGGRRLYSEDDLGKMRVICFLRDLGVPLGSIGELFQEEDPASVISLLIDQQKQTLTEEINERQVQLDKLLELEKGLKKIDTLSVESITDIVHLMETKKQLKKVRWTMLTVGLVAEAIEIGTLILGITKGVWWPFAIGMCIAVALSIWISIYYFKKVVYICPKCHTIFKPSFKEAFFARHTPTTRRLTCTHCGHKGFCVETYNTES
ncbi:MAG: MerR family transcriptional regulator [Clostridia bacterium]|nr:MerR family transcriptional regulator [Clostridia bacterium]